MLKKLGISLLLVITIIAPWQTGTPTNVYATPASCGSISECRENQREVRENIAEIVEQEEELSGEITEIQGEIDYLRNEAALLRDVVRELETEIGELSDEISVLAEEMEENLETLRDTEEEIEILIDEIARRMRITQRVNNQNSILSLLSEATSIMDFMRTARTFSQIATEDAENMNELTELMAFHDDLLVTLETQYEELDESKNVLQENVTELEVEQARMDGIQSELTRQQYALLERMYDLGLDRVDHEQRLAALEEAEEILNRTPPPPVVVQTPPSSSNSSNSSNNNASNNTTNNPPSAPVQSTGLAHPLPGARVSSEWGPRWGGHHAGIDLEIFSQPSAPILAAASGTVTHSTFESGMGWYVVISHDINGQRVDTLYGHLRYQPLVSAGDTVTQGQQIGNKGSTGFSTGPHLHFEVHPGGFRWNQGVNPRLWINF